MIIKGQSKEYFLNGSIRIKLLNEDWQKIMKRSTKNIVEKKDSQQLEDKRYVCKRVNR